MDTKSFNNVVINCPETGFALRKVNKCFTCGYYGGIINATQNGEPIDSCSPDFLQIICKRPITRKLLEIVEE